MTFTFLSTFVGFFSSRTAPRRVGMGFTSPFSCQVSNEPQASQMASIKLFYIAELTKLIILPTHKDETHAFHGVKVLTKEELVHNDDAVVKEAIYCSTCHVYGRVALLKPQYLRILL